MQTVLLIACSPVVTADVQAYFPEQGLQVLVTTSGRPGLEAISRRRPDLVLLTQPLPDISASEVLRAAERPQMGHAIPVLVLSSEGTDVDRVVALELGARDFVAEPVNVRELFLRARNAMGGLIRPVPARSADEATRLRLEVGSRRLVMGERSVTLSPRELQILLSLAEKPTHIWSRDEMRERVWGPNAKVSDRSVDACIKRLRGKVAMEPSLVETVWGQGYRLSPGARYRLQVGKLG